MNNAKWVIILLRVSIASVFLYAAVASLVTPENWIGYFPNFLRDLFPTTLLLIGFSIYEILLCVWLLIPWKTFYAAGLASATLAGIIITNIGLFDIVFRDLAILGAALALAVAYFPKRIK
jgi:uncharacterized membrane protein YphA (DoxX/SURF4 family)